MVHACVCVHVCELPLIGCFDVVCTRLFKPEFYTCVPLEEAFYLGFKVLHASLHAPESASYLHFCSASMPLACAGLQQGQCSFDEQLILLRFMSQVEHI